MPTPQPTRPHAPSAPAFAAPDGLGASAPRKGRGAGSNPTGRFERYQLEIDLEARAEAEATDGPAPARRTQYLPDPSRTALTFNRSPDIPFDASLNPYRGCEHGCAYCYARPTHEYLGYSAGLDFETKILVKERAPELLRRELAAARWVPQVVALSGVTDAYQPIERRLELTRRCIEVFAEFRNPITIVTKNALVVRDIDLFRPLAADGAISVSLSLTTLDAALQRSLEPRASSIQERLRAIEALARAGVPVGAILGPVIPGLTDHEIPSLLEAAKNAGAGHASYVVLRLPHGLKTLFADWLATHQPLRREKVLHRLESLRDGRLNDPRFGSRMKGEGHFADQIGASFRIWARRHGLDRPSPTLSAAAFRRPGGRQLELGL
ncbi:MAG: PA0069 family radical SAM protein [Myxococcota bacterium]